MPSIPAPRAMISGRTFSLARILSRRAFSTLRILPRSGRIAWKRRSRPCFAEPPAESPSTMYSSLRAGSRSWQSASLPGSDSPSRAPLRMTRSRALRAASRARAAVRHFSMIRRPSPGFSSRYWARLSVTAVWTWPLTSALPSFAFVWPSNCGLGQLDADDGGQALADVVAGEVAVGVLEDAGLAGPVVERARQRGPEAGDVGAAVDRVDVVGEGEDVLGVRVVVLEGDLDGRRALAPLDVDRAGCGGPPCCGSGGGRTRRGRPRSRTTARGRPARRRG